MIITWYQRWSAPQQLFHGPLRLTISFHMWRWILPYVCVQDAPSMPGDTLWDSPRKVVRMALTTHYGDFACKNTIQTGSEWRMFLGLEDFRKLIDPHLVFWSIVYIGGWEHQKCSTAGSLVIFYTQEMGGEFQNFEAPQNLEQLSNNLLVSLSPLVWWLHWFSKNCVDPIQNEICPIFVKQVYIPMHSTRILGSTWNIASGQKTSGEHPIEMFPTWGPKLGPSPNN